MTRDPKMPMLPTELPQQRLHAVVTLPPRPPAFDFSVGGDALREAVAGTDEPADTTYLAQLEWAWSPMNNRVSAYYLERTKRHWVLWSRFFDDNWERWDWYAVACAERAGANRREAAVYLLLEAWKDEEADTYLDKFHWINETGFLSTGDLMAIAEEVW